jgi:hypothetical protein
VARISPVDQAACSTREEASVILSEADSLLAPIAEIDGFLLGCLIDASTGMVVASQLAQEQDGINLDVMVTFHNRFHVIRLVRQNVEPQILLPGLKRARQLTASVLPGRTVDGYGDLITARLRKLSAARSIRRAAVLRGL